MGMRHRAAAILDRLKVFDALLWVRSRVPAVAQMPILAYHHLRDLEPDYPFDVGVVDCSPAEFDEQMAVVARHFTPVGIDELSAARDGRPLPKNAIAVTFDDGYKSNLELALPILKKHGVHGTFFLATGYLTERRLFWWDRLTYLVKKSPKDRITITYPRTETLDLGNPRARGRAILALLRFVKDTFGLDLDRFMNEVTEASGAPWDRDIERRYADELLLTWDEVRRLRAAGMDVQSHTRSHRVLGTQSPADVRTDILAAREDLERELGQKVRALSYPCGGSIEDDPDLCAAVSSAGYELGFSASGGMNVASDSRRRPLHLARISVDYGAPMALFRGRLALPVLVK